MTTNSETVEQLLCRLQTSLVSAADFLEITSEHILAQGRTSQAPPGVLRAMQHVTRALDVARELQDVLLESPTNGE